MNIRRVTEQDHNELVEFNQKTFPRRNAIEESLQHRFSKNPFYNREEEKSLLAIEHETIIGQLLMMPSSFKYRDALHTAYWGMDYIVTSDQRGGAAGMLLCKKALKEKYHFGIGLSKLSLPICLAFNEQIVGAMNKYIKIHRPLTFLDIFNKKSSIHQNTFPQYIKIGRYRFERIFNPDKIENNNGYWNTDEKLEFSRNQDFLNWRFFQEPQKYCVYHLEDSETPYSSYFVVRQKFWKKRKCLLLVDYRVGDLSHFDLILKATSKISKLNKFSATITGGSMETLQSTLKRNLFFRFGEKMEIVTNYSEIFSESKTSRPIMVTFADSDCEHYYGDQKW